MSELELEIQKHLAAKRAEIKEATYRCSIKRELRSKGIAYDRAASTKDLEEKIRLSNPA